jgi:RHS repeat-associated protein
VLHYVIIATDARLHRTPADLDYHYQPKSNKLLNVGDVAYDRGFKDGNQNGDDYTYDVNGNLTRDKNKGITEITYNHLNLPEKIVFGNAGQMANSNKINYIYTANGTKLEKEVTQLNGNTTQTTTQYAAGMIYKDGDLEFFPQPEGYVQPDANSGYEYVYQYKDHLGNIRLSYSDSDGNGSINASTEIVEENNYYPFGLQHKGYNNVVNGTENNYKTFQGQEIHKELGLNWIEFKYRNYDPAIGRFFNVDPLAEDYVYNGPYNFAENRVIDGIELEGLEWKSVKDDDGNTSLTLNVQLYNDSGLSDKQLTKLKTSITEQFTESYSNSDENITASLVIEDVAEAKGDFLVTLTEQTSNPVYDADGNKTGITYKGGEAGALGKTQKNDFEVTAKRDGSTRSNSDVARSFSHEAGHTAGLRHPWSAKQEIGDIKQGAEGVKSSTVRKNLMNSGGNKVKANRSTSGTNVTNGQLKSIDKLVRGQQK